MTAVLIILIVCHLINLVCNTLRVSSVSEIIVPIVGAILAGLAFIPAVFAWGFSFTFFCYGATLFLNTIRYGITRLKPKTVFQYIVYGSSAVGVIASIIGGTLWSCI